MDGVLGGGQTVKEQDMHRYQAVYRTLDEYRFSVKRSFSQFCLSIRR